jgi:hypothetical protein
MPATVAALSTSVAALHATLAPTATPAPLSLGEPFEFGGLRHAIVSYHETYTSSDGICQLANTGFKLIAVEMRTENASQEAKELPSLGLDLLQGEEEVGQPSDCYGVLELVGGDKEGCERGTLSPATGCLWLQAFRVPEGLRAEELVVEADFYSWRKREVMPTIAAWCRWRLGP